MCPSSSQIFDPQGPHDPTDEEYARVIPQRHHRWYQLKQVKSQGRIVEAYWRFNYFQYTWLTPYGSYMRTLFKRAKWTPQKQGRLSERYVLRMLTIAVLIQGVAICWFDRFGTLRTTSLIVAAVIGGFRVWEVFWAQAHYALQTEKSTLTSFTRTLLFHAIFLVESTLNGTSVLALHLRKAPAEVLPRLVDIITLQSSVSSTTLLDTAYAKWVAYGCLAVSLVILLVALPLIVGIVAKTWFQNSEAQQLDSVEKPGSGEGNANPQEKDSGKSGPAVNTFAAACSVCAVLLHLLVDDCQARTAFAVVSISVLGAVLLLTLATAIRMRVELGTSRSPT